MCVLLLLLSELLLVPISACIPYAALFLKDDIGEHEQVSQLAGSSQSQRQAGSYISFSRRLSQHTSGTAKDELAYIHDLGSRKAVPIAIPLTCVVSVLLVLLVLKLSYLKQRRLQTIHELPILLTALQEDEQESVHGQQRTNAQDVTPTNARSMRSRFSCQVSRQSSIASLNSATSPYNRRCPDPAPGLLVGMFGSPDWETNMQRELADHQWRLRRESRNFSLKSQERHIWHSQQSYTNSRNGTIRSRSQSNVNNQSTAARRHSSLRIPHVSSFGEMYSDTFRNKKRRPRSFNTVIDQMSASRSTSSQGDSLAKGILSQSNSRASNATGGVGFSVPGTSLSQRPSTIREVDTPHSTLPLAQDGMFRFQMIDFEGGTPIVSTTSVPLSLKPSTTQTGSLETGLGFSDMELSNMYRHLNGSGVSSIGGSWRQLPHFPSPPVSPLSPSLATPQITDAVQVNAVHVEPHYFDERLYRDIKTQDSCGFYASGCGLGVLNKGECAEVSQNDLAGFSPLTLDFGWPTLSDLLSPTLLNGNSSSAYDDLCKACVKPLPKILTHELEARSQVLQDQRAPCSAGNSTHSRFLSPLSAIVQNRHHLRVRDHVPFSLVTPPQAYLRSPRPSGRTVRFSVESEAVQHENNESDRMIFAQTVSLVDLSAPIRPSPLRRVASMGSVGSSRASSKGVGKSGNISRTSSQSSSTSMDYNGTHLSKDARATHESGDSSPPIALERDVANARALKQCSSYASLFLELGGSSAGYDDEPSDLYSFDTCDRVATDQSFEYPQASSSEILVIMEECSDNDIDYIAAVHSESFSGA